MKKFVVDAMLGKLSLWLRLTGNDTLYSSDFIDEEMLSLALNENRVLLTSDAKLHNKAKDAGTSSMLVRGSVDKEVALVFRAFGIQPEVNPSKSRCSKCNGTLREISGEDKKEIRNLVFDQTYDHYETFWLCADCNSVFFQGGHWKNITAYMERIRVLMEQMDNSS